MTKVVHSEIDRRTSIQIAFLLIAVGMAIGLPLWFLTHEPAVASFGLAFAYIGVMILISTFLPAWVRTKEQKVPGPLRWLLRIFAALSLIPLPPPWRVYALIRATLLLVASFFYGKWGQ